MDTVGIGMLAVSPKRAAGRSPCLAPTSSHGSCAAHIGAGRLEAEAVPQGVRTATPTRCWAVSESGRQVLECAEWTRAGLPWQSREWTLRRKTFHPITAVAMGCARCLAMGGTVAAASPDVRQGSSVPGVRARQDTSSRARRDRHMQGIRIAASKGER